jgi:hypothetical protein
LCIRIFFDARKIFVLKCNCVTSLGGAENL